MKLIVLFAISVFYCSVSTFGAGLSENLEQVSTIQNANSAVNLTVQKHLLLLKSLLNDLLQKLHKRCKSSLSSYKSYLCVRIYNALNYEQLFDHLDKFLSQDNLNSSIELTDGDNIIRQIVEFSNASTILLSAYDKPEPESESESESLEYVRIQAIQARERFISAIDAFTKYDQAASIMLEESKSQLVIKKGALTKHNYALQAIFTNRGIIASLMCSLARDLYDLTVATLIVVEQLQLLNGILAEQRSKMPITTYLTYSRVTEKAVNRVNFAVRLFVSKSIALGSTYDNAFRNNLENLKAVVEDVAKGMEEIRKDDVETIRNQLDSVNQVLQHRQIARIFVSILSNLATILRERGANEVYDFELEDVEHTSLLIEYGELFCQDTESPTIESVIVFLQAERAYFAACIPIMVEATTIPCTTSSKPSVETILQAYYKKDALIELMFHKAGLISIEKINRSEYIIKKCVAFFESLEKNRKELDEFVKRLKGSNKSMTEEEHDQIVAIFVNISTLFEASFVALSDDPDIFNVKQQLKDRQRVIKEKQTYFEKKSHPSLKKRIANALKPKKKHGPDESEPTTVDEKTSKRERFAETMEKMAGVAISIISQINIAEHEAWTDTIIPAISYTLLKFNVDLLSYTILLIGQCLELLTDDDFERLDSHRQNVAAQCEAFNEAYALKNEYERLQKTEMRNLKTEWYNYFMELDKTIAQFALILSEMIKEIPEITFKPCGPNTKEVYTLTMKMVKKREELAVGVDL